MNYTSFLALRMVIRVAFIIYLVEDDQKLNRLLTGYLQKENWTVRSFFNGEEALRALDPPPHLWIIDIILPEVNGYRLLREIKAKTPDIPIIFISSRDADIDRILGLELGSDDYLGKPFLPQELVLRARNLLGLKNYDTPKAPSKGGGRFFKVPPYIINVTAMTVMENNRMIKLTPREFHLLLLFLDKSDNIISREQIILEVWGPDYYVVDRVVDDVVSRLRKKMPHLPLETNYGYGYGLKTIISGENST